MRLRLVNLLITVFLVSTFGLQCQWKLDRTVARVDNIAIKLSEFNSSFEKSLPASTGDDDELEKKLQHLNTLIDKKLILVAAKRAGLDKQESLSAHFSEEEMRLSYAQLIDAEIIVPIIPESELKEGYKTSKYNLLMQYIYFPVSSKPTRAQEDSLRKKMHDTRIRLLHKEDFTTVAQSVSQDSGSGTDKGSLKMVSWLHANTDKELFRMAARLPLKRISQPIRTQQGYYLVRVEEKQKQQLKEYSSEREKIRNTLIRERYQRLTEKFETYKADLLKSYQVQIQDQTIEFLITKVREAIEPGPNVRPPDQIQFEKISDSDKEKSLVTFKGGSITIGRAIDLLKRFRASRNPVPVFRSKPIVSDYLDLIIPQELFVAEAYRKHLNRSAPVQKSLNEFKERVMMTEIERSEVNEKARPEEKDLLAYYEANASKFTNEASYKIQEIFVKDQALANQIFARAVSGESFNRLADKYSERKQYKKEHGLMGFITRNQYGEIGKTAERMQMGQISKPFKTGNNWSIIKLLEVKPATIKTFDEARAVIVQELKQKMLTERKEAWLKELRASTPVAIYENVIKS